MRIREIGLRRALGARKRHIRAQFLVEALVLTLVAGRGRNRARLRLDRGSGPSAMLGALFKDDSGKGDLTLRHLALHGLDLSLILVVVGTSRASLPALKASRPSTGRSAPLRIGS
jgi:putative ABC transport system permease protein